MENKDSTEIWLTGRAYFEDFSKRSPYNKEVAEMAEKLALALQEKVLPKNYLSSDDVKGALQSVNGSGLPNCTIKEYDAFVLLTQTWKYGNELGRVLSFDEEEVYWGRYKCRIFEQKKNQKSLFSKVLDLFTRNHQRS